MPATIRMGGGEPIPTGDEPDPRTRATPASDLPRSASECPTCASVFSGAARFCPFDGDPLRVLPAWNPGRDPLIGQELGGRYRIEGVLGEGGMGKVYAARHTAIDKPCAIKVLRRDVVASGEATARFLQEAKLAAALTHPNLVAVSDFGELEDPDDPAIRIPWFVMERLRGETLAQRLRRERPLPVELVSRIGRECAEGLAVAHARGIVHRDLKPDNVFLASAEDGRTVVKLLDFGVAKVAGASRRTRKGMTFGTPHYMSPEQAMGGVVDGRADLYALGIILYECLAGEVPFQADTFMGVLTKHVYETPEPLERVVDPGQLGELGAIVARCLAKRPEDRWDDAEVLGEALRLGEGPTASPRRGKDTLTKKERLRAVLSRPPPGRELPTIDGGGEKPRGRAIAWSVVAGFATLLVVVLLARSRDGGARPPPMPGALPAASVAVPLLAAPPVPSAPDRAGPAASVGGEGVPAPTAAASARSSPPFVRPAPSSSRPPNGRGSGEVVDPWDD